MPATELKQYDSLDPFLDYCVIYKDEEQSVTRGGVVLASLTRDLPLRGTIMAIGVGYYDFVLGHWIPTRRKAGDKVLFNRFAGYAMTLNGVEFIRLREHDLLGTDAADHVFNELVFSKNIQQV
jgi:chaperonin GroES